MDETSALFDVSRPCRPDSQDANNLPFLLILIAAFCACFSSRLTAQTIDSNDDSRINTFAMELMRATAPKTRGEIARNVLNESSLGTLNKMERHENDDVAILAAWEKVRRTMEGPELTTRPPQPLKPVPSHSIHRFLGFTSGRPRITPPCWWHNRFERLHYRHAGLVMLGPVNSPEETNRLQPDRKRLGSMLFPTSITAVESQETILVAKTAVHAYKLPRSILETGTEGMGETTVNLFPLNEMATLVAVHGVTADSYSLYRINGSTGEIKWEAKVLGEDYAIPGGTGVNEWIHLSEIHVDAHRVVVYGALNHSMYLQIFSTDSGEPLLRFSTSY